MKKLGRIITGFWLWLTGQNSKLSKERMKICIPCQYREGNFCGSCGCHLKAKTSLPEEQCPYSKWLAVGERQMIDCSKHSDIYQ